MAISVGLTNYATAYFAGVRYYVWYFDGALQCRRYIRSATVSLPFSDGTNISMIATSASTTIPKFTIQRGGVLVVDRPLVGDTWWVRHVSYDSGETWSVV